MRQRSPYESRSDERRAIADGILLLEWLRYTSPPWKYRESLDTVTELLCYRLQNEYKLPDELKDLKIVVEGRKA